jgi:hypothetical protein
MKTCRVSLPLSAALLGAMLMARIAGCRREPAKPADAPVWFADVTAEQGLKFIHDAGAHGRYFMPEHIGSGLAVFDADGDGRMDLYFVQNGGASSGSKNQLWLRRAAEVSRRERRLRLDVAGRAWRNRGRRTTTAALTCSSPNTVPRGSF